MRTPHPRYSITYAGITVLAALFFLGLVLLLFARGVADVRKPEITGGRTTQKSLRVGNIDFHTRLPIDGALFFYGLGLAVLGFGGMIVVGSYM